MSRQHCGAECGASEAAHHFGVAAGALAPHEVRQVVVALRTAKQLRRCSQTAQRGALAARTRSMRMTPLRRSGLQGARVSAGGLGARRCGGGEQRKAPFAPHGRALALELPRFELSEHCGWRCVRRRFARRRAANARCVRPRRTVAPVLVFKSGDRGARRSDARVRHARRRASRAGLEGAPDAPARRRQRADGWARRLERAT